MGGSSLGTGFVWHPGDLLFTLMDVGIDEFGGLDPELGFDWSIVGLWRNE